MSHFFKAVLLRLFTFTRFCAPCPRAGEGERKPARKIFLHAAIALMALAGADNAMAGYCTFSPQSLQIPFNQVNLPSSAGIGDTLVSHTQDYTVTCDASTSGYYILFTTVTWGNSSVDGVWATAAMPSVGVRVTSVTDNNRVLTGNAAKICKDNATSKNNLAICSLVPPQTNTSAFTFKLTLKYDLVKLANNISGTLSGYILGLFSWDIANSNNNTAVGQGFGSTTFTPATCTVQNNPIVVDLGAVTVSELNPTGARPFSIDLKCSALKNVKLAMTDAITPNNATDKLTVADGPGAATGVMLNVLYGGTPITFQINTQTAGILVGKPLNTTDLWKIPLTAQLIATGGKVTPGTINAAATFTLTYQ